MSSILLVRDFWKPCSRSGSEQTAISNCTNNYSNQFEINYSNNFKSITQLLKQFQINYSVVNILGKPSQKHGILKRSLTYHVPFLKRKIIHIHVLECLILMGSVKKELLYYCTVVTAKST